MAQRIGTPQKLMSAVSWNFLGKSSLYILKFFESLLLVRLIGTEQYGMYGSLINIQSIIALVVSLGLESVLSRFVPQLASEQDYGKLHSLLRRVVRVRALILIPVCILFLLTADLLSADLFHGTLSGFYLRLVVALIAVVSFHTIFRAFLDLFYHLRFIALLDIVMQASYLVIAFILVQNGYGLTGVLCTLIGVNSIGLIVLFLKYRRELSLLPPPSGSSKVARGEVFRYSGTLYVLTLLTYVLGKGMDVLLIGILVGDLKQVAFYLIAFNIATYAVSVMDMAVSGSFVASLIVEARTQGNAGMLRKIYGGMFELIYLFIVPIAVGGIILRNDIVQLLYTAQNLAAASMLVIFLVSMSIGKLSSIASTFLVLTDKERTITVARSMFGVANFVLDILLIPRFGAFGAVAATGFVMILATIYESTLLFRLIVPTYSRSYLWKIAASTIGMAIVVLMVRNFLEVSNTVKLPVTVLLGGGSYLACVFLLKPFSEANIELIRRSNLPFRDGILRLIARSE
ncbi:MAG TPA: oligosaccharide flippase family protein [Bacteroidota bacterium]|nr:oligosaccharide flippase family protein [Bacteroidota bacterium]